MSRKIVEIPKSGWVLKGMDKALSNALSERGSIVVVEEGQTLFSEGDEAGSFYVVRSGGLKATRLSREGNEQLLAVFGPGDSIGEMTMFDEEPRSATIVALRASSLLTWSRAAFFGFAESNTTLYRHLLGVMAKRIRDMNDALAARDFLSMEGRLARVMLRLGAGIGVAEPDGSIRIPHKLTQTELAAMTGASRESVSRMLNAWRRKGVIAREGGCYRLVDHEALRLLDKGAEGPPNKPR